MSRPSSMEPFGLPLTQVNVLDEKLVMVLLCVEVSSVKGFQSGG